MSDYCSNRPQTEITMDNKKIITIFLPFALIVGTIALSLYFLIRRPHITKSYESSITDHRIEVWVYGELFSAPGDAASGAGFVVLKDGSGRILEKKITELVISIDPPRWFADRVEIPLFAEWRLKSP